ncbi:MAG: hypothetical protein A2787_06195 [Omnitrophica WOR_2 bacterium RIFCSPHIGHO2_01_FULL_48_9]|nr:MAG: hypothetical protein A2787_06195 [Omnitrophica WOR_2 bacterium RIFCSPHIGHO2_01_FULL_48_9]
MSLYAKVQKKYFFILSLLVLLGCGQSGSLSGDQVCLKEKCIAVEVVYKQKDVVRGLQFRTSLPDDHGMLFVFAESAPRSFWMKDTFIPLDMIWLDYARRVVHIEENVPPCRQDPCPRYAPAQAAMYVLEVNARQAARLGIKVGEEIEFRLKDLK